MKRIVSGLFFVMATAVQAEWLQISDAATFNAQVVGHAYVDADGNWFQFNSDRSLTGGSQSSVLSGRWEYRSGMACFSRALDGAPAGEDCIVVLVDGAALVTVRNGGNGRQTQYTRR